MNMKIVHDESARAGDDETAILEQPETKHVSTLAKK